MLYYIRAQTLYKDIWRHPCLSELTLIIFYMKLTTHVDSETCRRRNICSLPFKNGINNKDISK